MFNSTRNILKTLFAGIFLILAILIIYKIATRPYMTIIIKYKETPPIVQNFLRNKITAYYRGYKVGEVSEIKLAPDQQSILFYLKIYYKDLKLPKNTKILLKTEDLFAARYFYLDIPQYPDKELLADGDCIEGTAAYERIDKYLITQLESGRLRKLVDNSLMITNAVTGVLQTDNKDLISKLNSSSGDIQSIIHSINSLISDPQVQKDIKSTINYSSRSIKDLNGLLNEPDVKKSIATAPQTIDKTVKNLDLLSENMPKVNNNLTATNSLITTTNHQLGETNVNLGTINCKVPEIPSDLICNADKTLIKADCLIDQLTKILGQRFLALRLLFGAPLKDLEKCTKKDCSK